MPGRMIWAMSPSPSVSIVVPLHNDAETVAAALRSALDQSLSDIEVICVDDASTDATLAVAERIQESDSRVRIIRHEENRSALHARRSGVQAARAPYVLFLDGDDELDPRAAEVALRGILDTGAEVLQFGVTVVDAHGQVGGSYERRLQPRFRRLDGVDVLPGLFPAGIAAQGQLWRYLFRADLLRTAYAYIPEGLSLQRVNDLPLMFLVASLAGSAASIDDHLYRYHLGRGGSGHRVDTLERAHFYASAIDSIDSIQDAVATIAASGADPSGVETTYGRVRMWIIGYVCSQLLDKGARALREDAVALLRSKVGEHDLFTAAGLHSPRSLLALMDDVTHEPIASSDARHVMLATSTFRTGGVSAVIAAQARILREAGYTVTVVARNGGSDPRALPDGVDLIELPGGDIIARMEAWRDILRERSIDIVIDHQVLYTRYWPEFAAMSRAAGAATVGWLHNFVARPIYDGDDRLEIIERRAGLLAHLVVLSPLDVAYLKLRGVAHASFAPNPPSTLLAETAIRDEPRAMATRPFALIWWGRLEEKTKRVTEIIDVASNLRSLGVDFRVTLIGPDWDDMTARKFNALARRRGLRGVVHAVGSRHGHALAREIDAADAFVSTSIIEGYQLTIAEAQSFGLPVFMYDLPWLLLAQGNDGLATAPQGEAELLAKKIARVAGDPEEYARMSRGSLEAARRTRGEDFHELYRRIVTGEVEPSSSPEPTLADAGQLLGLLRFYAERSVRATPPVARRGESWVGARLWAWTAPAGRRALARFPGLRPLAHRLKKRVGAD